MKKSFRIMVFLLAMCMVITLPACSGRKTASGYWVNSDYTEDFTDNIDSGTESATITNSQDNSSNGTTVSSNTSEVDRNSNTMKIRRNVSPKAKTSVMNNLNFGGKSFRMLVWNTNYTEQDKKTIKEFADKYNCRITVDSLEFESYPQLMATSISAGKPYDVVKLHAAHFPQVAINNLLQPLEKYISSSDITTSTNKTGVDWNKMKYNATWNNHVYYTIGHRGTMMAAIMYNKLMFDDFGLEDPLELYNKGIWTWDKIREYANIVSSSNSNVYLFDSSVSLRYSPVTGANFYSISDDGTIQWKGANTDLYTQYNERRKMMNLSPLYAESATVDTIVEGKAMMHYLELQQIISFTNSLKASAALGKNLENIGVVPLPFDSNGKYNGWAPYGYGSCVGAEPTVAVAFSIFSSDKADGWENSGIAAIDNNKALFNSLFDKVNIKNYYTFVTADGQRSDEITWPMQNDIYNKNADIMKNLESYAPKLKALIDYNMSKQ